MSIRTLLPGLAIALLAAAPVAQAADHEFCRDYAESAIRQLHHAEHHDRCFRFLRDNPARWQDNYKGHYEWCRGVSRDDAWRERNARSDALHECGEREHWDEYR